MISIQFIAGVAGFAGRKNVEPGTTLAVLIGREMPDACLGTLTITVNGRIAVPDYVLQNDDRVVLRPVKVGGAR